MADNPHSNNFLKNLSQKKYAWMEEAIAASAPAATALPTAAPSSQSSPHTNTLATTNSSASASTSSSDVRKAANSKEGGSKKSKKQKVSPEPDSHGSLSKKQSSKHHKKTAPSFNSNKMAPSSPPPKSPTRSYAAFSKEREDDDLLEVDDDNKGSFTKPKTQQPLFKYTTFPVNGYSILPTRNITSTFAKSDTSYFPGNKAGAEEIIPNPEEEWRDTIVIHPGSRNLRIGIASEAFPISVPHIIARRLNTPKSEDMDVDQDGPERSQEEYNSALNELKSELKWRMKNAKRRIVPNAEGQVVGFNSTAVKETILDHNDPYKVEWTEINKDVPYYVGEKALNVPISKDSLYTVKYPWKNGTLNNQDYSSVEAVLGDLEAIWTETIISELEVERSEFKNYNVALVVPDMLEHSYTCELVTMLLRYMNFKGVLIQQESTSATFGASVSSAVVVDIGAQRTKIVCVEDGVSQADSRMSIGLGGDDITKTFVSFLLKNKFPYADINLSTTYDWRLAETLKEKWCTMNEADISVQVYDFFARTPFKPTLKYQCKVYDEVFLAPLCLVYPNILEPRNTKENWKIENVTDDIVDDPSNPNNNSSGNADGQESTDKSQEYDSFPIDVAIAQSIITAANGSEEKLKRYFTSIILVGGGGKVTNFSRVLEDRVLSTIAAQKAGIDRVEVVPAPRELDPEVLVWKGASVMTKLDSAKEMWIGEREWEQVGARCLRERALLM